MMATKPTGNSDEILTLAKDKGQQLKEQYGQRKALLDAIEQIYLMDPAAAGTPAAAGQDTPIKLTYSPTPRNSLRGAMNLLVAIDPQFSIPYEKNKRDRNIDACERYLNAWWGTVGKIRQNPIHYDVVESALLSDEIHIGVIDTEETLKLAQSTGQGYTARLEYIASRSPFMVQLYNSKTGYADYDQNGVGAYYREVKMRKSDVLSQWGKAGQDIGMTNTNEEVTYCDFWDWTNHAVWIEGGGTLIAAEHKLKEFPIIAYTVNGSPALFDRKNQTQPFLYGVQKGQMWQRQNLILTAYFSILFSVAANPLWIAKLKNPDEALRIDNSALGNVWKIGVDEAIESAAKNAIDPQMLTGFQLMDQMITESTLYKQTLGQPMGGNAGVSMVSLLNSVGRHALVTSQRQASNALAKVGEYILHNIKLNGAKEVKGRNEVLKLKPNQILDDVSVDCKLEIDQPQDTRQNAMIAKSLVGFMPDRWIREKILNEGQSEALEQEMYDETSTKMYLQMKVEQDKQVFLDKLKAAQGIQGAPGQQVPPQQMVPPVVEGGQPLGTPGEPNIGNQPPMPGEQPNPMPGGQSTMGGVAAGLANPQGNPGEGPGLPPQGAM